jgi:putative NADPH-quinone reductase
MKILCIYRHQQSKENEDIKRIIEKIKEKGHEVVEFDLFSARADEDFERLIDLIWEVDKTVSWW